jgi:Caspase domain
MSKRAVLIGINAYQDPNVSDLAGCVNDIELVTDVLTTHHGFDEGEITKLVDPDNTRDQIFAALDELVDATQDGDVAVVYYSGHGSQAPDDSGDEDSAGYDETIVPADSGRSDDFPVRDIIDDELNSFVTALAMKTEHATFVFDSCHSGSVDRGDLPRIGEKVTNIRAIVPADRAPEGERRIRREAAGEHGKRSATGILEQGRYVLIAGCKDDQTSKETVFEGRRHGALTYYLMLALGSGQEMTVKQAFDEAVEGVTNSVREQDPVLEGPDDRLGAAPFGAAVTSA